MFGSLYEALTSGIFLIKERMKQNNKEQSQSAYSSFGQSDILFHKNQLQKRRVPLRVVVSLVLGVGLLIQAIIFMTQGFVSHRKHVEKVLAMQKFFDEELKNKDDKLNDEEGLLDDVSGKQVAVAEVKGGQGREVANSLHLKPIDNKLVVKFESKGNVPSVKTDNVNPQTDKDLNPKAEENVKLLSVAQPVVAQKASFSEQIKEKIQQGNVKTIPPPVVIVEMTREEKIMDFLKKAKVSSVKVDGERSKVIMNQHFFKINSHVYDECDLSLIEVTENELIFTDETGNHYKKSLKEDETLDAV